MTEQAQTPGLRAEGGEQGAGIKHAEKPAMSKFVVRMPAELLETLKRVSRHHNRSMNTEINLLLGRYIEQIKGDFRPQADEHLTLDSQLQRKLSALSPQKIEALLDLLE